MKVRNGVRSMYQVARRFPSVLVVVEALPMNQVLQVLPTPVALGVSGRRPADMGEGQVTTTTPKEG